MAQGAKFDAPVEDIAKEIIRRRGNITSVARVFGVSRKTIYRKIQSTKALRQAMSEAREERTDWVESKFDQLIDKGHWPAIRFYLETQARERGYIINLSDAANHASITAIMRLLEAFDVKADIDSVISVLIDIDNELNAERRTKHLK